MAGLVSRVLNRANARLRIFEKEGDYEAFMRVLEEAMERTWTRLMAYCSGEFVAKSPAEDPDLDADHHYPDDLADIIKHLDAKAKEKNSTAPFNL